MIYLLVFMFGMVVGVFLFGFVVVVQRTSQAIDEEIDKQNNVQFYEPISAEETIDKIFKP